MLNTIAIDNKSVPSKIEEVTVFFQGAELIHTANAGLHKGSNEICISGLSPNIDRNSVKIKTAGGVLVSSFEEEPETAGMNDYVTQSENQLNYTFNIDLPNTIPGNGKEQSIELKNQEVSATFKYYCAPKLYIETFLIAEIADWEKLNLLSGSANITYDGTYVGETFIKQSTPVRYFVRPQFTVGFVVNRCGIGYLIPPASCLCRLSKAL